MGDADKKLDEQLFASVADVHLTHPAVHTRLFDSDLVCIAFRDT